MLPTSSSLAKSPSRLDYLILMVPLGSIVVRCYEFDRMLVFWQQALGYQPREPDEDGWVVLRDLEGRAPNVSLERVPEPLAEVGVRALGGVPILVPEIVLLYKAHELTEKDEADFRSALPQLTPSRKAWLLRALDETRPNHPWARRLRG
jgi:Glyoxalase-like domain